MAGASVSGWFGRLAAAAAEQARRSSRHCILLWMPGGPSQTDTFDPKPDHKNGGPFQPIQTAATGVHIGEHLPRLAKGMRQASIIRSMKTIEGDHSRATYYLRTGYRPSGALQYPTLGSLLSKELGRDGAPLPNFVSISPYQRFGPTAFGPGYLGPKYAPLSVAASRGEGQQADAASTALRVKHLERPQQVSAAQAAARLSLLEGLNSRFAAGRADQATGSQREAYEQAVRMMHSDAMRVFDLEREPGRLRDDYGQNLFGQGCLLARRLVEQGVPFVEVALGGVPGTGAGWDTHVDNFQTVKLLCGVLDPAWAALLADLEERGLLDSTLVVWMGEFGRTPVINNNSGRDHFPSAWSVVLCGGGIRGGQVVGRTSKDGMTIEDRPVSVADLMATICTALGVDPAAQNMSNIGRPIPLADAAGTPIKELLG